jgi:glycosyltransferase involved in cell wall biosynthesis
LFKEEYNVDVIYFEYTRKLNLKKYDLIIGMGEGYSKTYKRCREECKRIYLATGTCFVYSNYLETMRWVELFKRGKGYYGVNRFDIESDLILNIQSLYNSSAVILGGDNDWVRESYSWLNCKCYNVGSVSMINETIPVRNVDIQRCKRTILFLCGNGCIHKGLDLVIEVLSKKNEFTLYIIGNIDSGFKDSYSEELKSDRVKLFDYLDVNDDEFRNVVNKCGYIISMSCSEGTCTSVLTGMNLGLIPIVSKADGIRVGDCGFCMSKATEPELSRVLDEICMCDDKELLYMMHRAQEIVKFEYSKEAYYRKFKAALKDVIYGYEIGS